MPLCAGNRLGHYNVTAKIGRDGSRAVGVLMKGSGRVIIALLATLFLSSCATTGSGGGWPVQTYLPCPPPSFQPQPPLCIHSAIFRGGFDFGVEFSACRSSLENYRLALDGWHR